MKITGFMHGDVGGATAEAKKGKQLAGERNTHERGRPRSAVLGVI